MELISLYDIKFAYPRGKDVLNHISFTINKGDRIGIIGNNGAGKSTLFQVIMGLLKPLAGEVHLFQKKCRQEKDFSEARKRIGLLFQDPDDQLFCPTVMEDVAFGPLNLGFSREEAKKRGEDVLSQLGILHLKEKAPHLLSGGEKRMASLATILSMSPEILLLDEPTTHLDDSMKEKMMDAILSYPFKALVVISHENDVLRRLVSTFFRLKDGTLT